jgi:iron complex outermembrane receptor protein
MRPPCVLSLSRLIAVPPLASLAVFMLMALPPVATAEERADAPRPDSVSQLMGQVRDAAAGGTPIPGVRVRAAPGGEAVTDAGGWFRVSIPARGVVLLRVEGFGFSAIDRQVAVPRDTPLIVEIERLFLLNELVVSASPLGSVATYQATQALGPDELHQRSNSSIGAMLDGEPGVAMRSLGAAPTRPVIRGFDGDRVLVLENGERMGDLSESAADHAVSLDPLALRRVEVVRGPASLLYGSSALGGVVNLMTADLPPSWSKGVGGSVQGYTGSGNRTVAAGGALLYGAERWAATARLSLREAGDIRTPEAVLPGTALSSRDGQLGLVRESGPLRVGVSASLVDRSYGIPESLDNPLEDVMLTMNRGAVQARGAWTPAPGGPIRRAELRANVARFAQQELERELSPGGRVSAQEVGLEFDQWAASATATVVHAPMGALDEGVLGAAVRLRRLEVGGEGAFTPGSNERAVALFSFQEIPLTGALRLQFGLRGEVQTSRARPNAQFLDVEGSRSATALSGSAGVNWRPTAGWELGAQLARAHRNPTVEELYADGPHLGAGAYEIGSPTLRDEVGHGLDLFVRRGWVRGGIELAAFYNRVDGFVAVQPLGRTDPASGLPVIAYQGTDARLMGGEAMAEVRATEALSLTASLDFVRGDRLGEAVTPLPTIPPFRLRLQARRDFSWGWVEPTLRAVAAQNRVAADEEPTAGYLLLEGSLGLRLGSGGSQLLVARVENALNRLYRDHLSRIEERGFPMPGRSLSLAYRLTF